MSESGVTDNLFDFKDYDVSGVVLSDMFSSRESSLSKYIVITLCLRPSTFGRASSVGGRVGSSSSTFLLSIFVRGYFR